MKKFLTVISVFFMMIFAVSCGSSDKPAAKDAAKQAAKVAIVYSTGGKGDKSFNDSAYHGLEMAKDKLGITFDEYEPKDPSAEAKNQLSQYAEKGDYALIIAVGFSMKDSLVAVAKEFPDQKFALIDEEVKDLPNVASLMFKEQEGSFLVGALAAMMTKTNTIGFVGGIDVPVIQRFESGYIQGAKYINKDIKILPVFINGSNPFNDPASAKALSQTLIQKGADMLFAVAGGSGSGVFQAAKEKGVFAFGVDSDQDGIEPGVILTSMVKHVDNAVFSEVKSILDGNFKSGVNHFGLADDGVSVTDFKYTKDKIGQEKIDKLAQIAKDIKDGKIKVEEYYK